MWIKFGAEDFHVMLFVKISPLRTIFT